MCKMPLELENLYFFFLILDSKDIKDKQLTVNFNTLNSTILQSNINIIIQYYNEHLDPLLQFNILDNKKQNNIQLHNHFVILY